MGQILSAIWRYFRPNLEDDPTKALLDHSPNQFKDPQQQSLQSHCITITDSHPVSIANTGNVPKSSTDRFGPGVPPYRNLADAPQQRLQGHSITISDSQLIPGSNSDNVPKTLTDLAPDVPSVVLDFSRVYQKHDKKQEKEPPNKVSLKGKEVVQTNVLKASQQIVQRIGPYTSMQKLLLVGEGDFSFSTSLAKAFGSASTMVATSLNSEDYLVKNYSYFLTNKKQLQTRGCREIHDVDARKLIKHPTLGSLKFDRIIYNFPHTGKFGNNDADLRANQELVTAFLKNAKKMMNADGEIHIRHKSNRYFLKWDIPKIGCDEGLHLIQVVMFDRKVYPGYHTKYGFQGDKDFNCNPSKTYKFALKFKFMLEDCSP